MTDLSKLSDRELLELAAEAAGYEVDGAATDAQERHLGEFRGVWIPMAGACWNSLASYEDAFILRARAAINLHCGNLWVEASVLDAARANVLAQKMVKFKEPGDAAKATCRAITLAAAAIALEKRGEQ